MLMNSICLCRVFILFPLSRLPAYNLGLTFGTRLRTGRKRQKRKIASEPSRAVVWEREREKMFTTPPPPPPHFRSVVHRFTRQFFLLFHPISYPESSGLLVSGGTRGHP